MTRQTFDRWQDKLIGYILVPHELLHVWAYRIIGKPCQYRWGNHYVRPLAKRTKRQRLFVLLFPFVFCWGVGLFFFFLWTLATLIFIRMPLDAHFQANGLTWHYLLPLGSLLFIMYGSVAGGDLMIAYNVLRGKDKSHEESYDPPYQADDKQ